MPPAAPRARSPLVALFAFLVLFIALVGLRRWVHHAQLELIPVIVPPSMASSAVLHPPPGALAQRMLLDVRDLLAPPVRPRYAVLTFDDGPYPVATPALLAQLRRLNVPADFFLIGRDALEQPAIAAQLGTGAHEIGNHTLSHPMMTTLGYPTQFEEILAGALAIEGATRRHVVYFRPPHGDFNESTIDAARAARETVALWNVDPGDWKRVTPQFIIAHVTTRAKSPAVLLLHNGSTATIDALPQIVDAYRRAGFEFVTLSQLQQKLPLEQINDALNVRVGPS